MSEENQQAGVIDLSAPIGKQAVAGELAVCRKVPYDVYKFAIKEEPTYVAESKGSGKPMLVFLVEQKSGPFNGKKGVWEPSIVNQETKTEETPVGLEYNYYASLSPEGLRNLSDLHKACGLSLKIQLNPETGIPMGVKYTGAEFCATASSETTNQQKDDGSGGKTDIINPLTGKALTSTRRQLQRIMLPE